eukprot:CAMPEP_0176504656 /NCGR_PEP_ID=MMETSP0200_2-20121128/16056_1 /TAXON_ID=947934 /ORGANISM="Chaetoceros sp., Strain GSL56" /LENGTH=65 /DNA_ID=CAMNT_0017904115 /DNA_START=113 /DNA_END=310 /DNA_ORIENTATION=+
MTDMVPLFTTGEMDQFRSNKLKVLSREEKRSATDKANKMAQKEAEVANATNVNGDFELFRAYSWG